MIITDVAAHRATPIRFRHVRPRDCHQDTQEEELSPRSQLRAWSHVMQAAPSLMLLDGGLKEGSVVITELSGEIQEHRRNVSSPVQSPLRTEQTQDE